MFFFLSLMKDKLKCRSSKWLRQHFSPGTGEFFGRTSSSEVGGGGRTGDQLLLTEFERGTITN